MQAAPWADAADPMLESSTALGWIAARTERIRLGTMVAAITYRPAAVLIKAVTTLDVLSGGRAWLGVGAGYHEEEASRFDLPLPPVAERFAQLEAALQRAGRMWDGEAQPVPLQRPPILIGGMGERKTLRLVARYADASNFGDIPDGGATIRHKLDVLARHCEAEGRPFDAIEKTVSTRLEPDEAPAAFAARCAALRDLGLDHVVVITPGGWTPKGIETIAAGLEV